jgi:hypothetical protein
LDNLSTGTRDDLSLACDFSEISANKIQNSDYKSSISGVELIVGEILDEKSNTTSQTGGLNLWTAQSGISVGHLKGG